MHHDVTKFTIQCPCDASTLRLLCLKCIHALMGMITIILRSDAPDKTRPSYMPFTIRPVVPEDTPALSRICLLTGDAGQSAEPLHRHGKLPGLVWALPYVLLPPETAQTWGFVLTDDAVSDDDHTTKIIKGYVVGTSDTQAFERATEGEWWPALRIRFPLSSEVDERTTADQDYIDLIHRVPEVAPEACLAVSCAHMHINLLPEVQRQGWGRKLIGCAVDHLRGQQIGALWVGMDERNVAARIFYGKVGFRGIEGSPDKYMALNFDEAGRE